MQGLKTVKMPPRNARDEQGHLLHPEVSIIRYNVQYTHQIARFRAALTRVKEASNDCVSFPTATAPAHPEAVSGGIPAEMVPRRGRWAANGKKTVRIVDFDASGVRKESSK